MSLWKHEYHRRLKSKVSAAPNASDKPESSVYPPPNRDDYEGKQNRYGRKEGGGSNDGPSHRNPNRIVGGIVARDPRPTEGNWRTEKQQGSEQCPQR